MRVWAVAAVALASVAGAAPAAYRADVSPSAKHGGIVLLASRPGHVTIGFLKLHLKGKTALKAPKVARFRFTSSAGAKPTVVLVATHTTWKKRDVTYSMLFAVLTPVQRQLAMAGKVRDNPPQRGIWEHDFGRFLAYVTTGIDPGEIQHTFDPDPLPGTHPHCDTCGKLESELLVNADTSPKRTALDDAITKIAEAKDLGPAWNPFTAGALDGIDSGQYDDGHALGWKLKGVNNGGWVQDVVDLLKAPAGQPVVSLVDDIFKEAGLTLTTPPPPTTPTPTAPVPTVPTPTTPAPPTPAPCVNPASNPPATVVGATNYFTFTPPNMFLPVATVGKAYSVTFTGSGGQSPYLWDVYDPRTIPSGLTVANRTEGASVSISGTPKQDGDYTFAMVFREKTGNQNAATIYHTLHVCASG
jgi:hypothetical protein